MNLDEMRNFEDGWEKRVCYELDYLRVDPMWVELCVEVIAKLLALGFEGTEILGTLEKLRSQVRGDHVYNSVKDGPFHEDCCTDCYICYLTCECNCCYCKCKCED